MSTTVRATLLFVLAFAFGCERDNPAPPDGGLRRDAQVVADAGGDAGSASDGGGADGGCVSDPDCWSCPPTTSEHLLNACTDATCEPFPVTQERLPLLRSDGTLPPLP